MSDAEIPGEFAAIQKRWISALGDHRMAPPDSGFARRLATLADVLRAEAVICHRAAAAGYGWPAHKSDAPPPYELQPNTGRRGPVELWKRFDRALTQLNTAAGGTDLLAVAVAFEQLGEVTAELAVAVEREDHAAVSGAAAAPQRHTA